MDLLANPLADPLATRRTRKTAGWRRNAPSLGHRGATDAAGVAGAAHAADTAEAAATADATADAAATAQGQEQLGSSPRTRKTVGWRRSAPSARTRENPRGGPGAWLEALTGGTHRPRTWSSVDPIAQLCDEVTNLAWRPEATKSENRLNFDAWSEKPSRGRGSHTGGSVHVAAAARCAREQNGKRAHQGDTSRELSLASWQQRIHYVDLSAA